MSLGSASNFFLGAASAAESLTGPIKSVRFSADDSAYLDRTPASAGNRQTWTVAFWIKICENSGYIYALNCENTNRFYVLYQNGDWTLFNTSGVYLRTAAKFKDPSAWYHHVIALDTTQATSTDRVHWYINGVEITDWVSGVDTYPSLNDNTEWNTNTQHEIGSRNGGSFGGIDYYLTDFYFVDGQQLNATSFGAFDDNGVWQFAEYAGTYGTNGFHLFDFVSNDGIGDDSSGNGNDWTVNNLSSTPGRGNDVLFDVPRNGTQSDTGAGGQVSANYATWNVLFGENQIIANGGLEAKSTTGYAIIASTLAMTSGKYYMEYTYDKNGGNFITFGVSQTNRNMTEGSGVTDTTEDFGFKCWDAGFNSQTGGVNQHNYGTSISDGDVLSLAFDADAGKLWVAKNGTWLTNASGTGDPANGNNPDFSSLTYSGGYFFMAGPYVDGVTNILVGNFGQRPWTYAAPQGFKALNTVNLSTPTIDQGSDYFDALTWTGDGGGSRSFTGLSFQPDFTWVKIRTQSYTHTLFDTVRGAGSNKDLSSDTTGIEGSANTSLYGYLSSFDSTGFSSTEGTSDNDFFNRLNDTYIAWNWDAGTSTVSNTDGTITSQVRANQSAGFSIFTFTGNGVEGATVGHGLGVAPDFVIQKSTTQANYWAVYHSTLGIGSFLRLDLTLAAAGEGNYWNSFSSTVFDLAGEGSTLNSVNNNGEDYVALAFSEVEGFSKFGTYDGNGSNTDGPFIYLGFRPAFFLLKMTTTNGYNWHIFDSTRSPFNVVNDALRPNLDDAEVADYGGANLIFCANGVKLNANWLNLNRDGDTFIYAAFAEHPLQANGGLAR